MKGFFDKRDNSRIPAFWRIYRDDKEWGYSVNLSHGGIKIWINEDDIPDDFDLGLQHTERFAISSVYYSVKKVWIRLGVVNQFNELGCQFNQFNRDLENHLRELILFFNKRSMAIVINNINRNIDKSIQL